MSNNFSVLTSEDPHKTRRKELLEKYPEIKKLMGHAPNTKFIALALVILQLLIAFYAQQLGMIAWFLVAYIIGATINHSLFVVIHDLTHSLLFQSRWANRCFAIIINLPLGIPVAMGFEKYHYLHHRFLGDMKQDVDIPMLSEATFFNSRIGKFCWLFLQPFTYTLRPLIKYPLKLTSWELLNIAFQMIFDILLVSTFGWQVLAFLIISTLFGMSLHPMATHFIAEHYVVHEQQETYSYYGPMNYITFNFGYHVEHHDFPNIPWSKLPRLKKIAPEFYQSLYTHKSWVGFMVRFVFSKKITLFSRIIR